MTKTVIDFAMAAECLRVLAHPGRLALVHRLLGGRYTVGELASWADLAPNVTSEHLRLLERCGLLGSEREGRRVYYHASEPLLATMMACITQRFSTK